MRSYIRTRERKKKKMLQDKKNNLFAVNHSQEEKPKDRDLVSGSSVPRLQTKTQWSHREQSTDIYVTQRVI